MKIAIVCSSQQHPAYPQLEAWSRTHSRTHDISIVNKVADLTAGDILFLISCSEIVKADIRSCFKAVLVVHASRLPKGRGWSPHIWQVVEGASEIPVTLLEAEDAVDSGRIWAQRSFRLEGHELFDEINAKLFEKTIELMDFAVTNLGSIHPVDQESTETTYYRKRTPADSELDPYKSIAEQFNLIRVADPRRFPSFFVLGGYRYELEIRKVPASK